MPLTPSTAGAYFKAAKKAISYHRTLLMWRYRIYPTMTISDRACPQKLGDSSSRRFGKWTSVVAYGAVIEMKIISLIHDPA